MHDLAVANRVPLGDRRFRDRSIKYVKQRHLVSVDHRRLVFDSLHHPEEPGDCSDVVVRLDEVIDRAVEAKSVRQKSASGGEISRFQGTVVAGYDVSCGLLRQAPNVS